MSEPHYLPDSPLDSSWNQTYTCSGRTYMCVAHDFTDSDVVGIGTMVSFLLPTLGVIIALVYGYFTCSLPGVQLTLLDKSIISGAKQLLRLQNEESADSNKIRKAREKFIETWVLSMSNQQLITGLAFLVASFAKCDLSLYSFLVSTSISWFTCIVHLSTLSVLHRYMRKYRLLRYLRLTGMIFIAGLLFTALVMVGLADSTVHYAMYCVLTKRKIDRDPGTIVIQIYQRLGLFVWLTASYVSRISALLSPNDAHTYGGWICTIVLSKRFSNQANNQKFKELTERARKREERPAHHGRKFWYPLPRLRLWRYLYIKMTNSFIWQIIAMFFGVAICITQLVLARNSLVSPHDENLTSLGFGQILSVCTLLLPIMGFLAPYYEFQKDINQGDHGPQESSSHNDSGSFSVLGGGTARADPQSPISIFRDHRDRLSQSDSSGEQDLSMTRISASNNPTANSTVSVLESGSGTQDSTLKASDLTLLILMTALYAVVFIPFGTFCAMFGALNFQFPPYFNFLTAFAFILLIPQFWLFVDQLRDIIFIIR